MRILSATIKDFRSIREVSLDLRNRFIIIEGENDVGKSNILYALDGALRAIGWFLLNAVDGPGMSPARQQMPQLWAPDFRQDNILRAGATKASVEIVLGFNAEERSLFAFEDDAEFRAKVTWPGANGATVSDVVELSAGSRPPMEAGRRREFALRLARSMRLIGTRRFPESESFNPHSDEEPLPHWQGRNLKKMLFAYKNHSSPEVQARFEQLVQVCADPDLSIGHLSVGIEKSELFARTRKGNQTLRLEDRSSGTQQVIFLLALCLCHEGTIVGIEEPELNLSTRLQRDVWTKLRALVEASDSLEQVMITSHSPVFEAEAERITVTRDSDGFTAAEARRAEEVADDTRPLTVARGGVITLPAETLQRLAIPPDKTGKVFLDESADGIRLLSPDQFAKMLAGTARGIK